MRKERRYLSSTASFPKFSKRLQQAGVDQIEARSQSSIWVSQLGVRNANTLSFSVAFPGSRRGLNQKQNICDFE